MDLESESRKKKRLLVLLDPYGLEMAIPKELHSDKDAAAAAALGFKLRVPDVGQSMKVLTLMYSSLFVRLIWFNLVKIDFWCVLSSGYVRFWSILLILLIVFDIMPKRKIFRISLSCGCIFYNVLKKLIFLVHIVIWVSSIMFTVLFDSFAAWD